MLTSVHVADIGVAATPRFLFRAPRVEEVPGLRSGDVALCAPLTGKLRPPSQLGRVSLHRLLGRRGRARRVPRVAPDGRRARRRLARAPRAGAPLRELARAARVGADRPRRGDRRARDRAHPRPDQDPRGAAVPADERAGRSERPARARPRLGHRDGPPAVHRELLALGLDARALDLRLRAGRPETLRRDRRERSARGSTTSRRSFGSGRYRVEGHLDGKNPLPQTWADAVGSA